MTLRRRIVNTQGYADRAEDTIEPSSTVVHLQQSMCSVRGSRTSRKEIAIHLRSRARVHEAHGSQGSGRGSSTPARSRTLCSATEPTTD